MQQHWPKLTPLVTPGTRSTISPPLTSMETEAKACPEVLGGACNAFQLPFWVSQTSGTGSREEAVDPTPTCLEVLAMGGAKTQTSSEHR